MSTEYNESNTVHGGADVQDSVPLTLKQVVEVLRNSPNYANLWSRRLADAIDAHLAKAGEPVNGDAVAKITRGSDDDFKVSWLIEGGIDSMVEGETLYILGMNCPDDGAVELFAAPPSAEPAQPGDAVGAFAPIPEAVEAPTPELWRAYEAFNDVYKGFNTQQALRAAINGVLAERAALALALAHPRPTGDEFTEADVERCEMAMVKATSGIADTEPDDMTFNRACVRAVLKEFTGRAPTVEQAGEVDDE